MNRARAAHPRVTPLVEDALRRARLVHLAEVLLVGFGAHLFVMAAGVHAGLAGRDPLLWGLGFGGGLLGALTIWLEQAPRARRLTARLDRELRLDGALSAAFEAERESSASPIAALLSARLRARLTPAAVRAAARPDPLPFVLLPLVGAVLFAGCLRARAGEPRDFAWLQDGLRGLTEDFEVVVGAAGRGLSDGEIDTETYGELRQSAQQALALATSIGASERPPSEAESEALRALRDEAQELARRLERDSSLREALERASLRADELTMAGEEALADERAAGDGKLRDEDERSASAAGASPTEPAGATASEGRRASGVEEGEHAPADTSATADESLASPGLATEGERAGTGASGAGAESEGEAARSPDARAGSEADSGDGGPGGSVADAAREATGPPTADATVDPTATSERAAGESTESTSSSDSSTAAATGAPSSPNASETPRTGAIGPGGTPSAQEGVGSGLAKTPFDGTMSGSPDGAGDPPGPREVDPSALGGPAATTWWSARNAPLAAKWAAAVRARRAPPRPEPRPERP